MINWIFGLVPWAQIGIICGTSISIITLFSLIGARWGPFQNWIGKSIQDALGITQVQRTLADYVESRVAIDNTLERAVQKTIEAQQATQAQLQDLTSTVKQMAQAHDSHITQTGHEQRPRRNRA